MKKFVVVLTALLILAVACKEDSSPVESTSQGSIIGTVTNKADETGVSKMNVYTDPPTSSVTTSESGSYRIDNIDEGTFKVTAAKDGFDTLSIDVTVVAGKETTADFIASPFIIDKSQDYGFVKGVILDKTTLSPIEGVNIKTIPVTSSVTSLSNGSFLLTNLDAGRLQIGATKVGYENTTIDVTILLGDTTRADIIMAETDTTVAPTTGTLTGKLMDAITGNPIADAIIITKPSTSVVNSDTNGIFYFTDLEPGNYIITVNKTDYQAGESEIMIEAGEETVANFSMLVSYGSVAGSITDSETGDSLGGVLITTTPGTSSILSGSDGTYGIQKLTPSTYTINAVKNGYESASLSISVVAGEITRADIVMSKTP